MFRRLIFSCHVNSPYKGFAFLIFRTPRGRTDQRVVLTVSREHPKLVDGHGKRQTLPGRVINTLSRLSRRDRLIVARHEYLLAPCSIVLVVLATRSYRTLRDGSFEGRFPRHFVPGYDRCHPSGTRWQTFRNSI